MERINVKSDALAADALAADVCPICYEEIKYVFVTECNHKFCKECINEWVKIKPTCPYCNRSFRNLNAFIFYDELEIYTHRYDLIENILKDVKNLFLNRYLYSSAEFKDVMAKTKSEMAYIVYIVNKRPYGGAW
jgi:hypothetical protein